jgi:hypothetical protein
MRVDVPNVMGLAQATPPPPYRTVPVTMPKSTLVFIVLLFGYLLAIWGDVGAGYRSGDEIGLVTGFADRGLEEVTDWRYISWIIYLRSTTNIQESLPFVIHAALLCFLTAGLVARRVLPLWAGSLLVILPTVFYFSLSFLRDIAFLLGGLCVLWYVSSPMRYAWRQPVFAAIIFVMLLMRPFYGGLILAAYLLSSERVRRYHWLASLSFVIAFLFAVPVAILASDTMFEAYHRFFLDGHVRGKEYMTVLMIPVAEFDKVVAALNFMLSPVFFWIVPATGIGRRYDYLLYVENGLIALAFVVGLIRYSAVRRAYSQAYRISVHMVLLSGLMAAATTVHGDSYRFRLFFLPFLLVFAFGEMRIRWQPRHEPPWVSHQVARA